MSYVDFAQAAAGSLRAMASNTSADIDTDQHVFTIANSAVQCACLPALCVSPVLLQQPGSEDRVVSGAKMYIFSGWNWSKMTKRQNLCLYKTSTR